MTERAVTRQARLQHNSRLRREQKRLNLRQAILTAAIKVFQQTGFETFSMRHVAEQIGYAPATLYQHFQDKDDLLFHIAMEGFRSFDSEMQQAYHGERQTFPRLRQLGLAYLRFALQHPVHYRLMFMQRGEFLNRECPPEYTSVTDAWGVLQQTVREGLEQGELRAGSVEVYTSLVWANIHGLLSLHLATPYYPAAVLEELYLQQLEVTLRGLTP